MSDTRAEQERFCAAAWPRLVAALSHHCDDVHLAEELVQEALVRACQRWRKVSRLDSPEGWTYRVAVNLSRSARRRSQAEQRARERHGPPEQVRRPAAVEDQLLVRDALGMLTARQREIVILRHVLDLSAEQVAALLGTSPGAVRSTTHRALARMREAIGQPTPAGPTAADRIDDEEADRVP